MDGKGKPLSKRWGDVAVSAYRAQGYLPEAMLNFLARLGWSHGDQEFFTIAEMVAAATALKDDLVTLMNLCDRRAWLHPLAFRREDLGRERPEATRTLSHDHPLADVDHDIGYVNILSGYSHR